MCCYVLQTATVSLCTLYLQFPTSTSLPATWPNSILWNLVITKSNSSCNVLLLGYNDDVITGKHGSFLALDYVGKKIHNYWINLVLCSRQNVITLSYLSMTTINTGFVNLLGNELSEQKVDNTGCPYDSSGLWGTFLLCCGFKSVTFVIHSFQNLLIISSICSLTVYKPCNNYLGCLFCVIFLYSHHIKWENEINILKKWSGSWDE